MGTHVGRYLQTIGLSRSYTEFPLSMFVENYHVNQDRYEYINITTCCHQHYYMFIQYIGTSLHTHIIINTNIRGGSFSVGHSLFKKILMFLKILFFTWS